MYIDCEWIYLSSSAVKQASETLRKIRLIHAVPFFTTVVSIHSCHHRLKMSSDQRNHCIYDSWLPRTRVLRKIFGPRTAAVILQIRSLFFQISWTWSDVFWINENFIQKLFMTLFFTKFWKGTPQKYRPSKRYARDLPTTITTEQVRLPYWMKFCMMFW